jgi:hypothetical protein
MRTNRKDGSRRRPLQVAVRLAAAGAVLAGCASPSSSTPSSLGDPPPRDHSINSTDWFDTDGGVWNLSHVLVGEVPHDDGRGIVLNPPRVNEAVSAERRLEAQAELEANDGTRKSILETLSNEQRHQYHRIETVLQNEPVAALALQSLLLDGRLTNSPPPLVGSGTLLGYLEKIATDALAPRIDRSTLLSHTVQELGTVVSMNQGPLGPAVPQTIVAGVMLRNPTEYARWVAGLASPAGEVTLAGGQTMRREPGTELPDDVAPAPDLTRSASIRLVVPALTEVANGDVDYVDALDDASLLPGISEWSEAGGLDFSANFEKLMTAIHGRPIERVGISQLALTAEGEVVRPTHAQAALMDVIERQLEAGPVSVGVAWGPPGSDVIRDGGPMDVALFVEEGAIGQDVLVTKITNQVVEFITVLGGDLRRIPREEFEASVAHAQRDPKLVPELDEALRLPTQPQ